jgi:hypothetical protein
MCTEVITATLPRLAKAQAGKVSKSTQNVRGMFRLLALRTPESEGSHFLISGIAPGQSCSCGILQKTDSGVFEILEEAVEPLLRTLKLLSEHAGKNPFELNVLELSSKGPPLPPKTKRQIAERDLMTLIASGRIGPSTSFLVKPDQDKHPRESSPRR